MQVGNFITFGKYEWRVLEARDDRALIITEEIIENRPYHNTLTHITWAECDMRKYLNGEFYDMFSDDEKSRIITVTNENPNNVWYGTIGGVDTEDSIFCLSFEDVVLRYFGDSSDNLYNRRKNQNYWFQRKDPNNPKRIAKYKGVDSQWHTRTPGRYQDRVANVGYEGSAHITGNPVKGITINGKKATNEDHMGIRPALWLRT